MALWCAKQGNIFGVSLFVQPAWRSIAPVQSTWISRCRSVATTVGPLDESVAGWSLCQLVAVDKHNVHLRVRGHLAGICGRVLCDVRKAPLYPGSTPAPGEHPCTPGASREDD